jgi:hypothetical protein
MHRSLWLVACAALVFAVACDLADTTDPDVAIVSPADGATLGPGNITIKAVATDDKGVDKVEFYAGATKIGEDGTGSNDTFDITWTAAVGSYTLKAIASDAAGNTDEDEIDVTIQTGGGGSGPTYHSGTIDTSETWYPSGNPHILTGDVSVQDDANSPVLTIMPGCIVQFQGDYELYTGYTQAGAIVANGKADPDSGILFTTTVNPKTPGSHTGIGIYYRATTATSFDYCTFEYGGSTARGTFYVDGATPKLQHSTISYSGNVGIKLENDAWFSTFTGNTVSNGEGHAIELWADHVAKLAAGNTFTGNANNDILVRGGDVKATGTWLNHGVPYVISGDVSVQDQTNSPVLTIAPGCSLKFSGDYEFYTGYTQAGAIIAEGTVAAPIVFSTTVNPKAPGSWTGIGIYYRASSATSFDHCVFEYAGSTTRGTFYVDGASPKLQNSTVSYSGDVGIKLENDGLFETFTGNTVSNCESHAIEMWPEYVRTIGAGNTITGNTGNHILVRGGDVKTTGTWLNHGVPYTLSGDVSVEDQTNSPVLTIAPGNTVELQAGVELYCGYTQPGGIVADGTSGQITFTSSIGSPSPGDWASISFYYRAIDSQSILKDCVILYGGDHSGNVFVENAIPTITGCEIGYSSDWGIYLNGTEYPDPLALQADNTFHDNASGDVRVP